MDKTKMRRLHELIEAEYGISDHMGGNGCQHGFKPACDCPNVDCRDAELHRLWMEFSEATRDAKPPGEN